MATPVSFGGGGRGRKVSHSITSSHIARSSTMHRCDVTALPANSMVKPLSLEGLLDSWGEVWHQFQLWDQKWHQMASINIFCCTVDQNPGWGGGRKRETWSLQWGASFHACRLDYPPVGKWLRGWLLNSDSGNEHRDRNIRVTHATWFPVLIWEVLQFLVDTPAVQG